MNVGYGRNWLQTIMSKYPAHGKSYFVAKTGTVPYNQIAQILIPDGDGDVRLFGTIEAAITAVNADINWSNSPWANGDVIYILPGTYAENLTALPHGCAMIGIGDDIRDGQYGVVIQPASGDPVDVSAWINGYMENIGFISSSTNPAFDAAILNNCKLVNCFFSGAAESTTATEAFVTNDCVKTTLKDCWAANATIGFRFEYVDGGDSISYLWMENCRSTYIATSGIYTSTNLVGPHSIVQDCQFMGSGQTTTKQIDDNSSIFDFVRCSAEGTTATEGGRSYNGCYGNGALVT